MDDCTAIKAILVSKSAAALRGHWTALVEKTAGSLMPGVQPLLEGPPYLLWHFVLVFLLLVGSMRRIHPEMLNRWTAAAPPEVGTSRSL
jgi:hypothetical protein